MSEKSIATIVVSALAGWLLGQITAVTKLWYSRWTLRRAIREEVIDLHDGGAIRIWLSLARSLQMHVNGGVDTSLPLPLKNEVYRLHYKDAVLALNRYQRPALEMLHQYVDETNEWLRRCREQLATIHRHHKEGKAIKNEAIAYGDMLRTTMRLTAQVQWHARFYASHPYIPAQDYLSPSHKAFVKFMEAVDQEMKSIEEKSIGIPREKFDQIYQPEVFDSIPDV